LHDAAVPLMHDVRKYCFKKKRWRLAIGLIDTAGATAARLQRCVRAATDCPLPVPPGLSILAIRLDHIGDVLLSTPALSAVRECLRPRRLDVLVGPWSREVLAADPDIDDLLVYPAPWHARRRPRRALSDFFRVARMLRRRRYDVAVDFRGDIRNIALMALSGIPCRIGYGITGGGFMLSHEMPYSMESRYNVHEIDRNLQLVERLGGTRGSRRWPCAPTTAAAQAEAESLAREHGLDDAERVLVVHVGAGYPSKCWPIERFAELGRRVVRRHTDTALVLTGGPDERALGAYCEAALPGCRNMVGATTLGGLSALLSRLAPRAVFVGADSGPMHLAWCAGMPVVGLFSGTDSAERWRPLGPSVVIQHDVPCKRCEKLSCDDHRCMQAITVDEVYDAVEALWHEPRSAP